MIDWPIDATRREHLVQEARARHRRTDECSHISIEMAGDNAGHCEVCGQVFRYRGLGLWEPVPRQVGR